MQLAVRRLDVDAFLATAGEFLARHEAEHNLLFGISSWVRANPVVLAEPPAFHVVTDAAGAVVAATLRTPPNNQVLSVAGELKAIDALAEAIAPPLPGVLGPKREAARFVERWTSRTETPARLARAERIYRLERVVPPRVAPSGTWRFLSAGDRDLVARWLVAFQAEAVPDDPPIDDPVAVAERWIATVGRTVYVWEDDDEVVSLVGAGGETPNGIRIGPVYTPLERRGRGYASALTAVASQDQLDRGRRFVFLFTDLANPISNRIYRRIGYQPVCDVDLYRFATDA
jgi:predicted GNAT family acetyltransferase